MAPLWIALLGAQVAVAEDAHQAQGPWWYEGEEIRYVDESYADTNGVVGGEQVTGHRWDATVGVIMYGYVGCTGTLIHPKVVLTAGHCIGGVSDVIIGAKDWWEDYMSSEIIRVKQEIRHDDYIGWGSDIGLLILDDKTDQAPAYIGMECILDRYLKNKSDVEIVGYGVTTETGDGFNTKLNHGSTKVQTKDCSEEFVDGIYTGCDPSISPGGEIGAGGNDVDACYGDSGGPLFLKTDEGDFLIGVTSRAYFGAPAGYPCKYGGIWTRPDYFIKWIEKESGVKLDYYPCNDAPDVVADPIVTRPGKTGHTALIVTDPDGDASQMTYAVVVPPENGTVTIEADGTVAYTANDGFVGEDRFTVGVTDAGNDAYEYSGDPVTTELEIPVESKRGVFFLPVGGCGCDGGSGSATGWLAVIGLVGLARRRR